MAKNNPTSRQATSQSWPKGTPMLHQPCRKTRRLLPSPVLCLAVSRRRRIPIQPLRRFLLLSRQRLWKECRISPRRPATAPPSAGPTTIGNASSTKTPLGGSIAPNLDAVLAPKSEERPQGDVPLELPAGLQGFSRLFNQGLEPALSDASVPLDKAAELPCRCQPTPKPTSPTRLLRPRSIPFRLLSTRS